MDSQVVKIMDHRILDRLIQEYIRIDTKMRYEAVAEAAGPLDAISPVRPLPPGKRSLVVNMNAIHAERPTRNFTFYPRETLRGDEVQYGYVSFVVPYGVPVLRHHQTVPGPFSISDCVPIGRVIRSELVRDGGTTAIRLTARIVDEDAIEQILSGQLHTVSIGHIPDRVICSVCKQVMTGEECSGGHIRGRRYPTESGEESVCYAVMENIRGIEVSFVNVPSDPMAMISSVEMESERAEHYFVRRTADDAMLVRPVDEGDPLSLWIPAGDAGSNQSLASGNLVTEEVTDVVTEDTGELEVRHEAIDLQQSDAEVLPAEAPTQDVPEEESTPETSSAEESEQEEPKQEEDDDAMASPQELWLLGEDDDASDISDEAKLTAAQRRRLPDSAFCGPNRSFPAHDKAHVLAGLRLLGRAKVSAAVKARIRACLIRRAARYGLPIAKKDNEYTLVIAQPATFEVLLAKVLHNKEALESVVASLRHHQVPVVTNYSGSGSDNSVYIIGFLEEGDLFSQIRDLVGVSDTQEQVDEVAEPPTSEEEKVVGTMTLEPILEKAKDLFGGVVEITDDIPELLDRVYRLYSDTQEALTRSQMELEEIREKIEPLEKELVSVRQELEKARKHNLAREAAMLAVSAGYPLARAKSLEDLEAEFVNRTEEFLTALIQDLRGSMEAPKVTDVEPPVGDGRSDLPWEPENQESIPLNELPLGGDEGSSEDFPIRSGSGQTRDWKTALLEQISRLSDSLSVEEIEETETEDEPETYYVSSDDVLRIFRSGGSEKRGSS